MKSFLAVLTLGSALGIGTFFVTGCGSGGGTTDKMSGDKMGDKMSGDKMSGDKTDKMSGDKMSK